MAKIIVSLLTLPTSIITFGWSIMMLFNWFVAPLGVPEVNFAHAYGLGCLMNIFHISHHMADQRDKRDWYLLLAETLGIQFGLVALVGVGWFCQSFM